jgi:hypothetical protein
MEAASTTPDLRFSMAQRSRRNPLRRQTQGCRNESRLAIGRAPASNLSVFGAVGGREGSRASRIDRSLPSLGHRFAQGYCGLPNGIPIPDHWKGRANSQPPVLDDAKGRGESRSYKETVSVGGASAPNTLSSMTEGSRRKTLLPTNTWWLQEGRTFTLVRKNRSWYN